MKQTILFAALGVAAFGAGAQEVGNVISSQPVVQQVAVPRQVCSNQPVMVPQQTSGGGGLLGAIIGGAVGNGIGGGAGHAAAIGLGAVAGAIVGNRVEENNNAMAAQAQMMPQCTTQISYENRTVAWNVTYEYAGRQYSVQMPYDPGPTVRLQVSPIVSSDSNVNLAQGQVVTAPAVQTVAAPMIVAPPPPAQVVYAGYPYPYPAYPVYRPYYPPISLSFGYVWGGGGHRHWR
jgi:uncharacterized protein YcfJ